MGLNIHNMPDSFQIFVKPVGATCNLGCAYCYYLGKRNICGTDVLGKMSHEILETYIRQHLEASQDDMVMFSWHGGEPLLAGIEFYEKAIELQKKFSAGRRIVNGIQTNGTLLNEKWCRFLSKEEFMIGISIDGPEEMHDRYRRSADNNPSFSRVMNGYRLLRKHDIDPEILCVVNSFNVRHPVVVYDFFRMLGAEYITFLPLVERLPGTQNVSDRSVPAVGFGYFLSGIFDRWVEEDIGKIKVQIFEEAARTAFGQEHTLCIFKKECGGVPVIEHNGDFYPCDHFVSAENFSGNIEKISVADLLRSREQLAFGRAKSETLPQYCIECQFRPMCNGECPKNRFINAPDGEPGLNYLCEGYKCFFSHCKPFIDTIAEVWKTG